MSRGTAAFTRVDLQAKAALNRWRVENEGQSESERNDGLQVRQGCHAAFRLGRGGGYHVGPRRPCARLKAARTSSRFERDSKSASLPAGSLLDEGSSLEEL